MSRELKEKEIKKGVKVLIVANPFGGLHDINIIGEVVSYEPENWMRIRVRYFDPKGGELDEKGLPKGEYVVNKFPSVHLHTLEPNDCVWLAKNYHKRALEFKEMYKELNPTDAQKDK